MAADTSNPNNLPNRRLAELMDGYLITQLLYSAALFGIADHLSSGPHSSSDLAAMVGADAGALHRVLRGLAAAGVLDEHADGRFSLAEIGMPLRSDVPGSLRGAILARGELYYQAAAGLPEAARKGGPAFQIVHGRSFFEYLALNQDREARFQASMRDRARQEATWVVEAYDFGVFRRLVDVGGGSGILLAAILKSAPRLDGVLFDRPAVIAEAEDQLADSGVGGRLAFSGGDFFSSVPTGADCYLLSRVIHDWDDAAAIRILANCAHAMGATGTLLLVEALLPERAADDTAAIHMDLHMLTLLGGRERTAAEYDRLCSAAGFQVTRFISTGGSVYLIETVPLDQSAPGSG